MQPLNLIRLLILGCFITGAAHGEMMPMSPPPPTTAPTTYPMNNPTTAPAAPVAAPAPTPITMKSMWAWFTQEALAYVIDAAFNTFYPGFATDVRTELAKIYPPGANVASVDAGFYLSLAGMTVEEAKANPEAAQEALKRQIGLALVQPTARYEAAEIILRQKSQELKPDYQAKFRSLIQENPNMTQTEIEQRVRMHLINVALGRYVQDILDLTKGLQEEILSSLTPEAEEYLDRQAQWYLANIVGPAVQPSGVYWETTKAMYLLAWEECLRKHLNTRLLTLSQ